MNIYESEVAVVVEEVQHIVDVVSVRSLLRRLAAVRGCCRWG
jgi:hypothetical protein